MAARVIAAAQVVADRLDDDVASEEAVAAAQDLASVAEVALQTLVDRARSAGRTWRQIGEVLGTSRQAAFQKFGHPAGSGEPAANAVPAEVLDRATEFVTRFTEGRWEEVLEDLDPGMRERHDASRLARGWLQLITMFGNFQRMGVVRPLRAGAEIIVDVSLEFEAGEAMLWARFDADGNVTGLRLHPAYR